MNASQKLKHLILDVAINFGMPKPEEAITADNIDALYQKADDDDWLQDPRNEVRGGQFMPDLPSPHSRNYEPYEVAARYFDGSYIGWTYWTGGGKHSNPEEIDFVSDAYDVTCTEEVQTVTVRSFSKVPAAA